MQIMWSHMFVKRLLQLSLLVVLAVLVTRPAAGQDRGPLVTAAEQLPWWTANIAELRTILRDAATVKRFFHELDQLDTKHATGLIADVKEYRLLDLNRDGTLELIALVDISGRALFNNLEIVYRTPDRFVVREIHGFDIQGLDSVLKDLDNDGVMEILVPQLLESYQGATRPHATLVEVYRWNGQVYERASARFPFFYREEVLPTLERELEKLDPSGDADLPASERAQRRLWRAKYTTEIAAVRRRLPER